MTQMGFYRLFVRDLVVPSSIGIHRHERDAPQRVRVTVEIDIAPPFDTESDSIGAVLSYDNVVAAVNFGAGLPRALVSQGAPVASVTDLNTYGLMNHVSEIDQRNEALQAFKDMYSQAIGSGPVMDYLSQTGLDALKGAEIIGGVTEKYSSDVEYAENSFSKAMKGAAQVLQADIGTRICYTQHGSFDAHTNGIALQEGLLTDVSGGIYDFYDDMKRANKSDDVIMFVFTEFGRRV